MADNEMGDASVRYHVGIDAGSVSLNCIVINQHKEIVYEFPYKDAPFSQRELNQGSTAFK